MSLDTPWIRQLKPRHQRQEERLGKTPGGQKGVASGRFWRWKRDGRLHGFLIEARTTEAGSFTFTLEEFEKIEKDAYMTPPGLLPGMQIDIQGRSLMLTDLKDFNERENRLLGEDA
jgi:hypothetical protein